MYCFQEMLKEGTCEGWVNINSIFCADPETMADGSQMLELNRREDLLDHLVKVLPQLHLCFSEGCAREENMSCIIRHN